MFVVIDKISREVFATETVQPADGAYSTDLFEIAELDYEPAIGEVIPVESTTTTLKSQVRDWLTANPQAKLLFQLEVPELETEISNLVDALFPTASAANRTRTKRLWMLWSLTTKIYVNRERLIN